MSKYINKYVLVAEIESKRDKALTTSEWNHGYIAACDNILSLLNTITVKEVDLKKEIKNRKDNLCNLYCYMEDLFNGKEEDVYPIPQNVTNELFEFARYFFELGLKTQNENKL